MIKKITVNFFLLPPKPRGIARSKPCIFHRRWSESRRKLPTLDFSVVTETQKEPFIEVEASIEDRAKVAKCRVTHCRSPYQNSKGISVSKPKHLSSVIAQVYEFGRRYCALQPHSPKIVQPPNSFSCLANLVMNTGVFYSFLAIGIHS